MSYKPTFKSGDHLAICDICGFKYKASELKLMWNGLRACTKNSCWNPRQPQDFLRGKKDDQSVPWTRSEAADTETTICTTRTAIVGLAIVGCAIVGNNDRHSIAATGTFDNDL